MECIQETGADQTEYVGGICTDDGVKGAIPIPDLDSFLVGFSADTEVIGLERHPGRRTAAGEHDAAPRLRRDGRDRHGADGCSALWLAFVWWQRRDIPQTPWFLRAVAISGAGAILALWCGWIVTEVGRQPWIVQGYMRTSEAVTEADGIWFSFAWCCCSTRRSGTIAILVLRAMSRRWREGAATTPTSATPPYGPTGEEAAAVSKADVAAVILWIGATFYALFGGADFGGGFWDLSPADAERGERPRALIQRSLTPVWEANHVWLIFILVVLWTAFPPAFSA